MAINMKSSSCLYYVLFLVLIFLLLVDKSQSSSPNKIPSLNLAKWKAALNPNIKDVKRLMKLYEKYEKGKELYENGKDFYDAVFSPSPPPPNAPSSVKGLVTLIKRYLSEFGYLSSSGPYNDIVDADTITAFKSYQQFFNLTNNEALQHMFLPRCRVPDVNFDDAKSKTLSWPKSGKRWFPKSKRKLSYFLGSEIPSNATVVVRKAFARWAEATTVLSLMETTKVDKADIIVDFDTNSKKVWTGSAVGGAFIRLRNNNVKIGWVFLNGNLHWVPPEKSTLSSKKGVFGLETEVMHQIGHLLGLDHSHNKNSIMYPIILPNHQRKVELSNDDKHAILKYYTHA